MDLEEVRDRRVLPVVKGVLADMAGDMASVDVTANTDFTALLIKILHRALDADLNLTTENPYVFQLVLDTYSAFSTVIQGCDIKSVDDARFAKIGKEFMAILSSVDMPLGKSAKKEDQAKAMEAAKPQIEALCAAEGLTWLEVKYITEGLFRSLKSVEQLFTSNVTRSLERMEAKILGIDDMSDLTMKKLDETLKADMKPKEPVEGAQQEA